MYLRYLLLFFALLVGGCTKPSAYCETKRQCYSAQECDVGQHACYYPDLATPDLATPDLATPDLATPDFATPDLATPDLAPPRPFPCQGATGWCKYNSNSTTDDLWGIWGDGPDNVWITGADSAGSGVVVHCTRHSCERVVPIPNVYFNAIWGVDSSNVFLVGTTNSADGGGYLVQCTQNASISCMTLFNTRTIDASGSIDLIGVWASKSQNETIIWAVGRKNLILRCQVGATPFCRAMNGPEQPEPPPLLTLAMVSVMGFTPQNPNDVWVSGVSRRAFRCNQNACTAVVHNLARAFYGQSLDSADGAWVAGGRDVFGVDPSANGMALRCSTAAGCVRYDVPMNSPKSIGRVFAIGGYTWAAGGVIARWSPLSQTFTQYEERANAADSPLRDAPAGGANTGWIWGLWASSPDDAWVVGPSASAADGPTVKHCIPPNCVQSTLPPAVNPSAHLISIWGADARNIWAVGTKGTILRYVP